MVNWNYLDTFCYLAENLSFTKTAEILRTSQSSISRQIKQLEENLGHPLFIRSKKSVALTSEGRLLKQQLNPHLSEIKKILEFKELEKNVEKIIQIKIASIFEVGANLIHPAILKFSKDHTNYQIILDFDSTKAITDKILDGSIDFGVVHLLPNAKTVRSYSLFRDRPVLICSTKSKMSINKLTADQSDIDLVAYKEDDQYSFNFIKKKMGKNAIGRVHLKHAVRSHQLMIDFVVHFDVCAVLPYSSAEAAIKEKRVKILAEEINDGPLYFCSNEFILLDKSKKEFQMKFLKYLKP